MSQSCSCAGAGCEGCLATADLAPIHPDLEFTDWRHAYVTGLIAAALAASEVFSAGTDTRVPAIRVRFGPHSYEVIVRELQ